LKRVKNSDPLNTKILQSSQSFADGMYRIISSYWLSHFFYEKIGQSVALFWFGLQIVGFLQIFYSQAVIPRTIVDSPAFLEHGSAEKIAVCAHTTHDPNKEDD
jgi:hypothetical protein